MPTNRFKSRADLPSPIEALLIAQEATPEAPPAVVHPSPAAKGKRAGEGPQYSLTALHAPEDPNMVLSHRYRESTLMDIARVAKAKGMTQKQLLAKALQAVGVTVHPSDLGVRPPLRRRLDEV